MSKRLSLIKISFLFLAFGMLGCTASKKIAVEPKSQDIDEIVQLIMTKEEKDIFTHLPDTASREEFITDFWAKRDPDPETETNEYKEEFLRRIEYANDRFNEGPPGWKTDRGRIYIYLGHPDKIEEFLFHQEPDVKGPILQWIYYRYNFGVQFADKEGYGKFTLDPYYGVVGDLFNAIEMAKLGISYEEGGFKKKFMNFDLRYESQKKEIVVSIPVKSLTFAAEEGVLKAEFEFEFYVYVKKGQRKDKFKESRSFEKPEEEAVKLESIIFTFPYELNPGRYYFDVVIQAKDDSIKTRKIFEVKN